MSPSSIPSPKCFRSAKQGRLLGRSVLAGASALTLASGLVTQANAAPCPDNIVFMGASSCTGPMNWTLTAGSFSNQGTITGTPSGVVVNGVGRVLDTIVNNGTITATGTAVQIINSGAVGHLVNHGLISSPTGIVAAAFANGTLGTITNTGTLSGGIVSRGANNLVIIGGAGSHFGTLTTGSTRLIESTIAGVTFASGNTVLDINVNTSLAQAMTNSGATIKFVNNRTLFGNFVQTGGSLMFAASAPTTFPTFNVTGTASLTGGNIVLIPTGAANASEGTYTIISAAGGVNSTVNATASGYTTTVTVAGTQLLITLTRIADPAPGVTPPASSSTWALRAASAGGQAVPIGPVLDALAGNSDFQGLLAALNALSVPAQNRALQQLGAPPLGTQALASGATFALSSAAIGQRQTTLLAGQSAGKAAGSAADSSGAWVQVLGNRASLDGHASAAGFDSSAHGMIVGADTRLGRDLVGGGAFSWVSSKLAGEGSGAGSQLKVDSYQLAAYGVWRPHDGPAYVNGLVSVGRNHYDQARNIDFLASSAAANYRGSQAQLKLEAGFDIALGTGWALTPLVGLQATRIHNQGYQETGAGVAGLSVARQKFNSVDSELGARLSTSTDTRWGRLSGDVQAGWVHSFTNKAVATTASMGGVNFVTTSERLARDGAHVLLRATLKRSNGLSYAVEYDGQMRSRFRSQTAMVKMRYDF